VHSEAENRIAKDLQNLEMQKKQELSEFNNQIENYKAYEKKRKEINRENQKMNRTIWQEQIKARQEREKKEDLEDKFAPVGTPQDFVKSHYSTMFEAPGSASLTNKGRMQTIKNSKSNPHQLQFPKYYEFQDEQPLYPFPLEDALRTESQNKHAMNGQLMTRNALLDQISYNKIKREAEKNADNYMGQIMAQNAQDSLSGENAFLALKKQKATEAMRNQWQQCI
jgi:isochorismate hydrolase